MTWSEFRDMVDAELSEGYEVDILYIDFNEGINPSNIKVTPLGLIIDGEY